MTAARLGTVWLAAVIASCGARSGSNDAPSDASIDASIEPLAPTSSGAIALANLDAQIAERASEPGGEELLLARARFLADVDALERASGLAEARCGSMAARSNMAGSSHAAEQSAADLPGDAAPAFVAPENVAGRWRAWRDRASAQGMRRFAADSHGDARSASDLVAAGSTAGPSLRGKEPAMRVVATSADDRDTRGAVRAEDTAPVLEARCSAGDLVRRARTRAAEHRFRDALEDLAAAERSGARGDELEALRASVLVATGRAAEAVPALEAALARRPALATRSALAAAYAALGRLDDADGLYAAALAGLDTTSPFPYAWIYFARGRMWSESGSHPARAAQMYARALVHLPMFVAANVELAALEAAHGARPAAIARLERVVAISGEPDALAGLGAFHLAEGAPVRAAGEVSRARARFEQVLARHPLAFADHAAAFYLAVGDDRERAWLLAQQNLANRPTRDAFALAIAAAQATGRAAAACALSSQARAVRIAVADGRCSARPARSP